MMPDRMTEKNWGVPTTKPELPFDKFMDAFSRSKFGKAFAAITGISLVVASVDAACTNAQPTNLSSETAPVPSGVPTLATPVVETAAPTVTVPPTVTEAPTPTKVENLYPIEKAKLFNNMPKSYDYLTSHLDEYVQAPDATTPEFMDWWKTKLIPSLGDETKLERNIKILGCTQTPHGARNCAVVWGQQKPMTGQPEFFYFKRENKIYPVLIVSMSQQVTSGGSIVDYGTATVVLEEPYGGWEALEKIAKGEKIRAVFLFSSVDGPFDDTGKQMVAAGLDGSDYKDGWLTPAMGFIQTEP